MAKQFNTAPYVKEWDQGNLGTAYKNTLYNNVCKIYQRLVGMFFFEIMQRIDAFIISNDVQYLLIADHKVSEVFVLRYTSLNVLWILETSLTLQFSTAWKHNLSEKS